MTAIGVFVKKIAAIPGIPNQNATIFWLLLQCLLLLLLLLLLEGILDYRDLLILEQKIIYRDFARKVLFGKLEIPDSTIFGFFFDAIILIIEDSLCILLPSQTVVAIIIIIGYVSPSDAKSWIKTKNDIRPPVLKITSKQDSLLLIFCSNI